MSKTCSAGEILLVPLVFWKKRARAALTNLDLDSLCSILSIVLSRRFRVRSFVLFVVLLPRRTFLVFVLSEEPPDTRVLLFST